MAPEGSESLSSTLAGVRESYYDYNMPIKHPEIWLQRSLISCRKKNVSVDFLF